VWSDVAGSLNSYPHDYHAVFAFSGRIVNASNIGLSSDDLGVFWNEEHPDDLVE